MEDGNMCLGARQRQERVGGYRNPSFAAGVISPPPDEEDKDGRELKIRFSLPLQSC